MSEHVCECIFEFIQMKEKAHKEKWGNTNSSIKKKEGKGRRESTEGEKERENFFSVLRKSHITFPPQKAQ